VQSTPFLRPPILLLIALLAGCAGAPDVRKPPPPGVETARALEARGEFTAAADTYLATARATRDPTGRAELRLAAASVLLRAAELARAEEIVLATTVPPPAMELTLKRDLLFAEIALGRSRPGRAMERLPPTLSDSLPIALRRQHLELRARALLDSGNALGSVRERLLLDTLLENDDAVLANQVALLGALRSLGPARPELGRTRAGRLGCPCEPHLGAATSRPRARGRAGRLARGLPRPPGASRVARTGARGACGGADPFEHRRAAAHARPGRQRRGRGARRLPRRPVCRCRSGRG
jgi:hypothetical protein